nr:MAG TPA: hypothetical protein [Caudoviricetes sp.]
MKFYQERIHPVVLGLDKFRANTWDQDKISFIQKWLIENFETGGKRDNS